MPEAPPIEPLGKRVLIRPDPPPETYGWIHIPERPSVNTGVVVATGRAPGWIWCDDFEEDRRSAYFEWETPTGGMTVTPGVGMGASAGLRAHWEPGEVYIGKHHLAFGRVPHTYTRPVDEGVTRYRELYWRLYIRYPAGWVGGAGDKLSRATSLTSADWRQAMVAHVWGTGPALELDPASGTDTLGAIRTTRYNDVDRFRWLGVATASTPVVSPERLGIWQCVEAGVRLNDTGQSNGWMRLWIDDTLVASRSGLNWLGSYGEFGINALFFEHYRNDGSPAAQDRYVDRIVVSTEPIGC